MYGPTEAQLRVAERTVNTFNAMYPPGSAVTYNSTDPRHVLDTTTRGEAFVSHSGCPVIFLNNKSGYVALTHVSKRTLDEERECLTQLAI
jgi:hypothetical protein